MQAQTSSGNNVGPSQPRSTIIALGGSGAVNSALVKITGYVFLGVRRGDENRVAEINVHGLGDDQFFEALRVEYYKMKGYLRRYYSIWRYKHCDFFMVGVKFLACPSIICPVNS
jgi:hypothetical protein